MSDIKIGPAVNGYTTTQVFKEKGFMLALGRSNTSSEPPRRVATCEAFGQYMVITDERKYERLAKAHSTHDAKEIRRLLNKFLLEHLADNPNRFAQILDTRYEEGVQAGKEEKVREFRKVFEL